jgi:hypothetical protein
MQRLQWRFPIRRPHAGVPLADGRTGLLVWGETDVRITIGRAGFWDHRGGTAFASATDFATLRALLEAGDQAAIQDIFGKPGGIYGYTSPHQVSGGRLVLTPPRGVRLLQGEIDHESGTVVVHTSEGSLAIRLVIETEQIQIDGLDNWEVALLPAWEVTQDDLAGLGMQAPVADQEEHGGWFEQSLPEDNPLAIAWHRHGGTVVARAALGQEARATAWAAVQQVDEAQETRRWWRKYWSRVPYIRTNDPVIDEIVHFGLYQQACVTPPHGLACTLQGPYLEDYQIPPWSCDYHFNINIQMIYWPTLASGQWDHLNPMWDLLRQWMPVLRENAQKFFGADDAIMLPHAVDDRCSAVGSFWTGTIDQACTAWMAQLAWLHYQYSGDRDHLRDLAMPLLRGAFAGFFAMMEETPDGQLSLPVSVSPEFGGSEMHAWGRDASFQLAACHALLHALPHAANILGEPVDPVWLDVAQRLPAYTVVEGPRTREQPQITSRRIALWHEKDLPESHRHHSHLGAIFPFMTIDPEAPEHAELVQESMHHWQRLGPGAWSGWCVPWAAILLARTGQGDGALRWLHTWNEWFVNEGRGTLHDARCAGLTTLCGPTDLAQLPIDAPQREIMQLDARFGALAAVFELLVQQRGDVLHLFPHTIATRRRWTIERLWAPGGLQVSMNCVAGQLETVTLRAMRAYQGKIAHHLGPFAQGEGEPLPEVVEVSMAAGAMLTWTRSDVSADW